MRIKGSCFFSPHRSERGGKRGREDGHFRVRGRSLGVQNAFLGVHALGAASLGQHLLFTLSLCLFQTKIKAEGSTSVPGTNGRFSSSPAEPPPPPLSEPSVLDLLFSANPACVVFCTRASIIAPQGGVLKANPRALV